MNKYVSNFDVMGLNILIKDKILEESMPVNILTLGGKNDGSEDVSEIINKYTSKFPIYLPCGTYRCDKKLNLVNGIIGGGLNTWGCESRDVNSFARIVSNVYSGYAIELNDTVNDMVICGVNIALNGTSGGIKINTSAYSVTRLCNITIESCGREGILVAPKIMQSRCCTIDNCMVFGIGQIKTVGYKFTSNAPDCRITNSYSSQIQVGLRAECNLLCVNNCHFWSGLIGQVVDDDWYAETKGISLSGCTLYATNLYLDTAFIPIFADGVRSNVFIDNLIIWYDDTISGTTRLDGSLVYGNVDVVIEKGLIYPFKYLRFIGVYDNVTMNNVIIKTDNNLANLAESDYWKQLPYIPCAQSKYFIEDNVSSTKYVEIASGYLDEYCSGEIHVYDNWATDCIIKLKKDAGGVSATLLNRGTSSPELYIKINYNEVYLYHKISANTAHNVYITGSRHLRMINYNNVKRIDNSPYVRNVLDGNTGLTPISE